MTTRARWCDEDHDSGTTAPATKGRYETSRPHTITGLFSGGRSTGYDSYDLIYQPDYPQLRSGRTTDVPLARNLPVTEASVVKAKAIALAHHKAGKDR
jgi:hypothetical protein